MVTPQGSPRRVCLVHLVIARVLRYIPSYDVHPMYCTAAVVTCRTARAAGCLPLTWSWLHLVCVSRCCALFVHVSADECPQAHCAPAEASCDPALLIVCDACFDNVFLSSVLRVHVPRRKHRVAAAGLLARRRRCRGGGSCTPLRDPPAVHVAVLGPRVAHCAVPAAGVGPVCPLAPFSGPDRVRPRIRRRCPAVYGDCLYALMALLMVLLMALLMAPLLLLLLLHLLLLLLTKPNNSFCHLGVLVSVAVATIVRRDSAPLLVMLWLLSIRES